MNKLLLLLLNYYCATHATSCLCKRIPLLCWIEVVVVWLILGVSGTRGKNCLFMSKVCHHNEKPSVTGLLTKAQNLVVDGQTSKMPLTTFGAGQIETNWEVICSRVSML